MQALDFSSIPPQVYHYSSWTRKTQIARQSTHESIKKTRLDTNVSNAKKEPQNGGIVNI